MKQVIQHTFVSGTNPAQNYLRRINGVNDFTLIAAANGAGGFNDFDQIWAGSTSLNSFGEAVFLTRQGNNTTILVTGERPDFSTFQFPSTGNSQNPMISDAGCVITRAGVSQTDPLRLYSDDLTEFETIASVNDGFTAIGLSSSISKNCEVIVFYGDLNETGAQTLGTNPGPGIFASIEISFKQRRIVRLAGRLIEDISAPGGNNDGYCDAGETCIQGELGFDKGGNPIFFNSFDTLNRVDVAHQSNGAQGIADDIFVVSFLATPNIGNDRPERPFSNQPGLWTLTTQIKNENGVMREKPSVAVPVIQIGDVVNERTVTAINVYDQIAGIKIPTSNPDVNLTDPFPSADVPGGHRLAFHVATSNGNMIIRAERNIQNPVIFVLGIMGSRLAESNNGQLAEKWVGVGIGLLTGSNFDQLIPSANANIVATDSLRAILNVGGSPIGEIYGPVLEALSGPAGLVEYQIGDKPERRTSEGCDMNQRFANPKLFVFAYDWRKSNSENADKLEDYVRCVQRFYPETEVDIVAHSMGGLLARRYIISNPEQHYVRKLITIGSPFLGAPKALDIIETGRLRFTPEFLDKRLPSFVTNRVKTLAKESQAVHELFPSEAYFALGGTPFAEETFDINGDGTFPQIYNYTQTKNLYDLRFSTLPYSTNEAFHGTNGQDDWRLDNSGVEYYHIFGQQRLPRTIEQVIAKPIVKKPISVVRQDFKFRVKNGFGDGTVPIRSAEKCQNEGCVGGLNFNASTAEVIGFVAQTRAEDNQYEHNGLVKDEDVLMEVLTRLDSPIQPIVGSAEHQNKEKMMRIVTVKNGKPTNAVKPPPSEGYYITIEGVERLDITDDLGNTNTPIGDMGFELAVPGVQYYGGYYSDEVTQGYHGLSLPAVDGEYTIKFRTENNSIDIEILKGVGDYSPNLAIRYIDLDLPANVECILIFSPQGVPDLRYDSNGDGTFDVVVPAHVRVTGTLAQDVTAPNVSINFSRGGGGMRRLTINAVDTESGVGTIYYRIGQTGPFQIYTGSFIIPPLEGNTVEAFADDNVGNRSSPITATLPSGL